MATTTKPAVTPAALQKKVSELETRIKAIELRLGGEKQYARLSDNPPTVEHAFAINEILKCAKALATLKINDNDGNAREYANEILGRLPSIGM